MTEEQAERIKTRAKEYLAWVNRVKVPCVACNGGGKFYDYALTKVNKCRVCKGFGLV